MTENNEDKFQKLFDVCPYSVSSKFERQNFQAQPGPGYARYLITTINRIRKINSEFDKNNLTVYETNCLLEEKATLLSILENEDIDELELTIKNWEFNEREYWAEYLGKIAAIELLTYGKASVDTMTKMVKLPEDLYIKSTQICVTLANKIKEATVNAEQDVGVGLDEEEYANSGLPSASNETTPTTLVLKKIK